MVQQQIIKNITDRLQYNRKIGKFKKDDQRFIAQVSSLKWNETIFKTLDQKPLNDIKARELTKTRQYRACREIIVPVPHSLGKDKNKQMEFIKDYMAEFQVQYNLDNNFVWSGFIHHKMNDKGKMNFHAHILFSERELLEQPKIKHFQKRYLDENGKICNKTQAYKTSTGELLCVPAYDKKIYFNDKKYQRNGEYLFHSMSFCYQCDEIWKKVVLDKKIMTRKELSEIFIPKELEKTKHIGNKYKWSQKAKETKRQIKLHNIQVLTEFERFKNKDKSKAKGIELEI